MRLWQTGMGARGKVGGDGQRGGQEAADGEGRSPAGQCEARWVSAPERVAHMSTQHRSYPEMSRSGFTTIVVDGSSRYCIFLVVDVEIEIIFL